MGIYNPSNRLQLRGSYAGNKPTAAQILFDIPMLTGDSIFDAASWALIAEVAPAGNVTLPVKKNGTTIGNGTIGAGNTTGGFTLGATTTFVKNDALSLVAPTVADGNLSGLGWLIRGSTNLF